MVQYFKKYSSNFFYVAGIVISSSMSMLWSGNTKRKDSNFLVQVTKFIDPYFFFD